MKIVNSIPRFIYKGRNIKITSNLFWTILKASREQTWNDMFQHTKQVTANLDCCKQQSYLFNIAEK